MARSLLFLLSLIVPVTSFTTPVPAHSIKSSHRFQLKANIIDTAAGAGKFKILIAAITEAGLAPVLSGGKFTVFAPSDEAFAALPEGTVESLLQDSKKLISLLTFHVVSGVVSASSVDSMEGTVDTLNGASLKLGDAKITTGDIACDNGVIHIIDKVLLPASMVTLRAVPLNGWLPNPRLPCFGLPGVVSPTGFFDPLGFAQGGIPLNDIKRYRESEVMHGRVAMMAAVGFIAGEAAPFGGPFSVSGPANDQLAQLPLPAMVGLTLAIGACEIYRAMKGWVEPGERALWTLRDNYYPGDVGFDPLGLKPTDAAGFAIRQTKELQNGRLAMIGVAGMCLQEICNHKTIFETYEFYSKLYSGVDPYA